MNALVSFKITDRPDLQFRPFAVDGTEGLSQLYKFDIDCFGDLAQRPDSLELIGKRAVLRFELEGAEPREIFGIIKTITSGAPSIYGDARYRFQLVPWLERLNYSRASQIHGTNEEVSVVDVIEAELRGGLRRETRVMDTDFRIFEHELRLKNRDSYPKRDHVVQADETDFAFISRMAEHHGIYYFFENTGGVEKVVFSDDNLFTRPIEGEAALDWKPWRAGSRAGSPDTIQEFDEITRMIPRRVWMLDYNYRVPHVPLLASAQIDSHGLGHWVEYGSHHRTPAEGETLARIRAEEMRSNQRRWTGKSAVARLSPGRSFKLHDHPYTDWNQEYLVVSVHHEVRVPMPGVELKEDWSGYRNSFEVIQQKTPFRPARVTPKPRMDGLMNARIDGAGQRDKAELDDQGRYRVRVPFDNSDTPDGKGSQWVRMASPFGGDGDGMHFPLAPDTEVVIACVNGDPNRPVILGTVPNPRNKSVVTNANSKQNVIATRTGMSVVMGSDGGSGGVAGGGSAAARVATPSAYGPGPDMTTPDAFGAEPVVKANDLETPPQLASSLQGQGSASNYIALNVDDKHIIRAGAGTGDRGDGIFIDTTGKMINTIGTSLTTNVGGGETRTVTGDQATTVKGNQTTTVKGNQTIDVTGAVVLKSAKTINIEATGGVTISQLTKTETTTGNQTKTTNGTETTMIGGHAYTYKNADSYNATIGRTHNFFVSATMSIGVGGLLTLQFAPTLAINLAPTIGIQLPRLTMILGNDLKFVTGADNKLVLGVSNSMVVADARIRITEVENKAVGTTLNALAARVDGISSTKEALAAKLQGLRAGLGALWSHS